MCLGNKTTQLSARLTGNTARTLVDLALRMLGDLGAAEDAAQDALTRLLRADAGEKDDERGWFIG